VKRVVKRRRARRRVVGAFVVVAVVAVGLSVAAERRSLQQQVVLTPGRHATRSSTVTTPARALGSLGYPQVAVRSDAFRGYGRLAYYSGGALRILDGSGGTPRVVSIPAAPQRVAWSADGKWLAVQTDSGAQAQNGQGDLYVVGVGTSTLVRVGVSGGTADWQWSPTRDVLAVVDQSALARNGTIDVFSSPDFARPAAQPIAAEFPAGFLAWSPNGQRLLYKTYTVKAPFIDKLWSVDESTCPSVCGASATPMTVSLQPEPTGDIGFIFAGWSADATRLLVWLDVAHSGSTELDGLNIASVPVNGGVDAQLPATLAKPSWIAPVPGTHRAIVDTGAFRTWDSHRHLDSCDLDTGRCAALVVGKGPVLDPAVSPDGSRLAYVASDPDVFAGPKSSIQWSRSRRLVVAGIGNQHPEVIATGGVVAPRWAADSAHLLFWRAGYIWLVDTAHPSSVAVAGQVDPRDDGATPEPFEGNAYIWPGNDVWDVVAWQP
jgi:hypothetical protein